MTNKELMFIEDFILAGNKEGKSVSGDYCVCKKTENYTDFIICDGIGSGIKASIAARMSAHRISTLLISGMSLKKVTEKLILTMHGIRDREIPYAAFLIVRIMNNGNFTAYGFEFPRPVILYPTSAGAPEQVFYKVAGELSYECAGVLRPEMSMIICSDGITQSGMGRGLPMGITEAGIVDFFDKRIQWGQSHIKAANELFKHSLDLSGGYKDDMSLAVLKCRNANVINVMSGPPANSNLDFEFVKKFTNSIGEKIICGSSTVDMVSRISKKTVYRLESGNSFADPPGYAIDGIDIASEGAVTLNQLYNILDENPENFDTESRVTEICKAMQNADIIRFYIGDAVNKGHESVVFRQTGIMTREKIIPLIIKKLEAAGKIVTTVFP